MVVPWVGIPLHRILSRAQPTSGAKFVLFKTLLDPAQFPAQKTKILDWPYQEGLRLDEAMNDLTLLATGLYGEPMPNSNGAPIRVVVPWKYGFKSAKSIAKIRFVEKQPLTAWMQATPNEYGFYSNVNPTVDHPRWTQSRERRLPASLFSPNWQRTLAFNGYASDVAGIYAGMDLRKLY